MNTKYIVKLSDSAFASINKNTVDIKRNFMDATMYPTYGAAMKAAIFINSLLNTSAVVRPYYINK